MISEAFEAVGRFPRIYTGVLKAGERSGNLDRVLAQYVAYQKIRRSFRKKFFAALFYPALLVVFLTILVTFVIGFIVPQFAALYADLEVKLPFATQLMIAVSLGIKRIALVGDKTWEKWMARVCKPFTMAKIRYFDTAEIAAAKAWLGET